MATAATMAATARKRAVVVGLGLTGLSCVRHLVARGYDVRVVDSRREPPNVAALGAEFPGVPVHAGGFAADWLAAAELLVVSPGVSLREPALANALAAGAEAVGDVELFAREARAPVIAVTGSNGKSTVTSLVGVMCRTAGLDARVGGNIGVPALALLGSREPDVYVLELSSFQLETTRSLDARAAVVLNLTPDHMDRYRDLAEYAAAKQRIFRGSGVMVLNADDAAVRAMAQPGREVRGFTLGGPRPGADYGVRVRAGETWLVCGDEPLLRASEVPLPGRHNLANALAAAALADALGVPRAAQREAIRAFRGLPHRTERVAEIGGVRFINDSKGTNVGATVAALSGMEAPVVLIAGGDGKGQDFAALRAACTAHARAVVLIGRDAGRIEAALAGAVPTQRAADLREAVVAARTLARPGDVVLLSPACASFDMFRDYEHRGETFRAVVQELSGEA
ncbi:MAG TPA: UDP-N-acetylmuramoyl-L-alanine--D-glutamate ligase [Burkholderiales bacterium]